MINLRTFYKIVIYLVDKLQVNMDCCNKGHEKLKSVFETKKTTTNSDGALINCFLQPGELHRDTKRSSIYRDFAKTHANRDTDGT